MQLVKLFIHHCYSQRIVWFVNIYLARCIKDGVLSIFSCHKGKKGVSSIIQLMHYCQHLYAMGCTIESGVQYYQKYIQCNIFDTPIANYIDF